MKAPDILLIDANAIGYAAMHQKELAQQEVQGQLTGAIQGLLASAMRLIRLYPNAAPILLWDGTAQWRYDLYPDYKISRNTDPETVRIRELYAPQAAIARQMLWRLGVPQIANPDVEADDVAGLITQGAPRSLKILMVSTDSDWVQALAPNVALLHPRSMVTTNLNVLRSSAFRDGPFENPDHYLTAKCLAGDISDDITGIENLGMRTSAQILTKFDSLAKLWALAEERSPAIKGKRLEAIVSLEGRRIYERNRQLMDWSLAQMPKEGIKVHAKPPVFDEFLDIVRQHQLERVGNSAYQWVRNAQSRGITDLWLDRAAQVLAIMNEHLGEREAYRQRMVGEHRPIQTLSSKVLQRSPMRAGAQ